MITKTSEDPESKKSRYVIHFINTGLAGCEYVIYEDKTTFVVTSKSEIACFQQQECNPAVIYILDDNICTHFDILFYTDLSPLPELITGEGNKKNSSAINFHQIIHTNGVYFALRPEASEWQTKLELEQMESVALTPEQGDISTVSTEKRAPGKGVLIALIMMMLLAASGLFYFTVNRDTQQITALLDQLGEKKQLLTVFKGNDSDLYIFARESIMAAWVRQWLKKNSYDNFSVLLESNEEERMVNEIRKQWPELQIHGVRFDSPVKPVVLLSLERASYFDKAQLNQLAVKLGLVFPWAENVNFSYLSDKTIANFAEQRLLSVSSDFSKRENSDTVIFTIRGKVNDSELTAFKSVINDFKSRWKGSYVQFVIKLDENKLKVKSRLSGSHGYTKVSDDQWDFFN